MPDWPDDDLDLDAPLALPAELRGRLADALGAGRLAAAMEGLDGPRPLSPELRSRLEARLRSRHRRRPAVVAGAVAAALVAVAAAGLAVALSLPGTPGGSGPEASRHAGTSGGARPTAAPAARPGATSVPAAPSLAAPDGGQFSPTAGAPDAAASPVAVVPGVAQVAPAAGPVAGGNWVVVDGTGLAGARAVTFGGVPATFVVVSDGELRARAPAHGAGTVDVAVRTAAGTSPVTPADRYHYG